MVAPISHRHAFIASCCALYLYLAFTLAGAGAGMFIDTDPFWHVAAGDLIRQSGIPATDSWSFTTEGHPWFNISWGWDAAASWLVEHNGWRALAALNAVTIALTLTLLYALGVLTSGSAIASALSVFGSITLLSLHLRPLQVTDLLTALWLLTLSAIARDKLSSRWLAALPVTMILWVNTHGGFLMGPILLAAFFFEALWRKNYAWARQLLFIGVASAVAALCNPYGIHIITAALQPLNDTAGVFIKEWQPLTASPKNLLLKWYAILFVFLVLRRSLPISPAERGLAYFWLLMGIMSERHMYIFAVVSAPAMACGLQRVLAKHFSKPFAVTARTSLIRMYDRRWIASTLVILSLGISLWLPSASASKVYAPVEPPVNGLDVELDFIKRYYSKTRFLNHFDIGGIIVYRTRGEVPVYIDPRTQTAYPTAVIQDYVHFKQATPGWEAMLDRYKIGGAIIPNDEQEGMLDRFSHRSDWKEVFKGQKATVFIRK